MITSIPIHKYIWVDSSFIRRAETGFEPAVWFGLVSQHGRAWGLNVMLECGAIYRSLPPHAIAFSPSPPQWSLQEAQVWDCYSNECELHEYTYLRELSVRAMTKKGTSHAGTYLFTAAFLNDAYTRTPEQQKEFSFIQLDNHRLTIQPTNRTLFEDRSFTINSGAPNDLITQTQVWSCE